MERPLALMALTVLLKVMVLMEVLAVMEVEGASGPATKAPL